MKTTVVGSYPVPGWLLAQPTAPNLRDALLVVLRTQELAGIEVLGDGELSRFDASEGVELNCLPQKAQSRPK